MIEDGLELSGDYSKAFIKTSITDLKKDGVCYVFTKEQVSRIKQKYPEIKIEENECGYTIRLRKEDRK